ncbi:phage tail terminator protein [Saccharopolyspora pogona]|uniref:phage tail terminator protein n=1 Tax=Saccharopolyspora pogona TaxID=333966 RepID=UPI001685FF2F|nr:minor capsid protein [Saccharopolyspora pogona]
MWATKDIIDWLQTLGITVPLHPGTQRIPEMPDRIAVVTPLPGTGLSMEGLADSPGFQLRCRGAQMDPDDCEAIAYDADRRILGADFPATLGIVQLTAVTRSGGRPALLSAVPDAANRTEMVCTYLTTIMEVSNG